MNYSEAMQQLRRRDLKPIYLLTGTETYLIEQFLKTLFDILHLSRDDVQNFDGKNSIKNILHAADSPPFFSGRNVIFVKDTRLFADKNSDKDKKDALLLADYISSIPDFSLLIFTAPDKIDRRRKAFRQVDKYGAAVECNPIPVWQIDTWLNQRLRQMNLRPDREAYAYLSEAIKAMEQISLGFIDQELTKLALYTDKKIIDRAALEQVLSSIPEISSFRLWDALCEGNIAAAVNLYTIQQSSGVSPLRLLALLSSQMRRLWQVRLRLDGGANPRQLAAELKVPPFIAEKISSQARRFSLPRIHAVIRLIAEADYKLKTGSDEPALIENIFIAICRR